MTGHVLISPLGFAPGAVSGVYFALKKKGVSTGRVITVGTAHPHVRNAAAILEALFRRVGELDYKACYIDALDLRGREQDASGPFAARVGLYIDRARQAGQTVHVAVTGGRSGMGALAALAAQLYRADHLYHLWVNEEIEREGIARATPDPDNRYVNPTVEEGLCDLVSLPFLDLSNLIEEAEEYRRSGQVSEVWPADRLVGEAPAMLKALSHYVPAGLTLAMTRELLGLIAEWRENVEWITEDDPTRVVSVGKIDRAAQEAIWHRALSILYTAGVLDDESRENLRRLMSESIAGDYARHRLEVAAEKDDLGILQWLVAHKEVITTSVTVGTFVLKIVELWLKARGVI